MPDQTVKTQLSFFPEQKVYKPFLKWPGGKRDLLPQIEPFLPKEFVDYYEPFLGGGSMLFHLQSTGKIQPNHAYLSDINDALIATYQAVQTEPEKLIEELQKLAEQHSHEFYYKTRDEFNMLKARYESCYFLPIAARFIYLNKTGFNGVYRENLEGSFNIPIGDYQNPAICQPDLILAASEALQSACIGCRSFQDWSAVIKMIQPSFNTFVYLDPPYHPLSTTASFTKYNKNGFGEADQIQVAETFRWLAESGVQAMLSNSDCKFTRDLYRDFRIETVYRNGSINSNTQERGKVSEILVIANIS